MSNDTDDRIARLTALAQRVPEWPAMVQLPTERLCVVPEVNGVSVRIVDPSGDLLLIAVRRHPRAADALEAALLVLAGGEVP